MESFIELFANRASIVLHNLATPKAMEEGKTYSQLKKELVETEVMDESTLNIAIDELENSGCIEQICTSGEVDGKRLMHHPLRIIKESPIYDWAQNEFIQKLYDRDLKKECPQYHRE